MPRTKYPINQHLSHKLFRVKFLALLVGFGVLITMAVLPQYFLENRASTLSGAAGVGNDDCVCVPDWYDDSSDDWSAYRANATGAYVTCCSLPENDCRKSSETFERLNDAFFKRYSGS